VVGGALPYCPKQSCENITYDVIAKRESNMSPIYIDGTLQGSGGSDDLHDGAVDAAALRLVTGQKDKQLIYVESLNQLFHYEDSSTATDDGLTVIRPGAIAAMDPGRWLVTPPTPIPPGWNTKYSVDFSALPALDIKDLLSPAASGAVTIDGKTWQAEDLNNATALDIDGSTGIVWDTATGTYDYGNRSSPHLYALISSLWPSYNAANNLLRIWSHFSFVPVNNWDSFMMMLERQGGVGGELMAGSIFRHDGGNNDQWGIYHGSAGGANGFTSSGLHLTDDVMCIEQTKRGIFFRSGTYSGGWPNIEDMNLHGHITYDKSGDLLLGVEQTNAVISFSNFKNTGAPADATLIRLRLDAK